MVLPFYQSQCHWRYIVDRLWILMGSGQDPGLRQDLYCVNLIWVENRRGDISADLLRLPCVAVALGLCWGGLSCSGSIRRAMESWQEYNYSDIYLWKAALQKASPSPWQHDFLSSSHLLLSSISEKESDREGERERQREINLKNGLGDSLYPKLHSLTLTHSSQRAVAPLHINAVPYVCSHCWMGSV